MEGPPAKKSKLSPTGDAQGLEGSVYLVRVDYIFSKRECIALFRLMDDCVRC